MYRKYSTERQIYKHLCALYRHKYAYINTEGQTDRRTDRYIETDSQTAVAES
jgi:hypothetical protein